MSVVQHCNGFTDTFLRWFILRQNLQKRFQVRQRYFLEKNSLSEK